MTGDLAAYGVAFAGLGDPVLPEPPADWPRWTLAQVVGAVDDSDGMDVWPDRARIGIPEVGEFRLHRERREIVLGLRAPWPPDAVLHPGLAPAASVIAHWMGRATFHAAAVLVDGRIWGLLGEKGAGKSTTAAHLAQLGCRLVTDDLLVVDAQVGFAGPGVVDLRADVGPELGGRALGVIGARERWRLPMPIGADSAPLGGWVSLGWAGGDVACEPLAVPDRLARLDRFTMLPPDGTHLLEVADLPMLSFSRRFAGGAARSDAATLLRAMTAASHR